MTESQTKFKFKRLFRPESNDTSNLAICTFLNKKRNLCNGNKENINLCYRALTSQKIANVLFILRGIKRNSFIVLI